MDSGDGPELLLREGDTAAGWSVVTRLIASMQHNAVRSLSRPIEVGYGEGPENWSSGDWSATLQPTTGDPIPFKGHWAEIYVRQGMLGRFGC